MWRCSCVAVLLPALLLLWCGARGADGAPLFGLLSLLGASTSTSGNSLLTTLLLDVVQTKIDKLEVIADIIAIAGGTTNGS